MPMRIDDYKNDDGNGIIAVGDMPQQLPHAPLVVKGTDMDNTARSDDDDNDNNDDDDNNVGNDNNDDLSDEGDDNEQ